jgi:hypothetical protein
MSAAGFVATARATPARNGDLEFTQATVTHDGSCHPSRLVVCSPDDPTVSLTNDLYDFTPGGTPRRRVGAGTVLLLFSSVACPLASRVVQVTERAP